MTELCLFSGPPQIGCVVCSRQIQTAGSAGHDPREDAVAAMELSLLKLQQGLCLSGFFLLNSNSVLIYVLYGFHLLASFLFIYFAVSVLNNPLAAVGR